MTRNDNLAQTITNFFNINSSDVDDVLTIHIDSYNMRRKNYNNRFDALIKIKWINAAKYAHSLVKLKELSKIRDYFKSSSAFEIGYITHEIMSRYRLMIELLEAMDDKKIPNMNGPLKFFVYENLVHQSVDIIHLCNMIHELPTKDVRAMFAIDTEKARQEKLNYEKLLKRQDALDKQKKKHNKNNKLVKKGKKKRIRTQWKWKFPLQYGWSVEDMPDTDPTLFELLPEKNKGSFLFVD